MPARVYVPVSGHENGYAVLMQLRYRYRVDPQPRHLPGFARAFGCTRFVVNDALAFREAAYQAGQPYPSRADLSARLTVIKADPERAWLGEVSAVILQQGLVDLDKAYRRYFAYREALRTWTATAAKDRGPGGPARS
jgi:putative transposase